VPRVSSILIPWCVRLGVHERESARARASECASMIVCFCVCVCFGVHVCVCVVCAYVCAQGIFNTNACLWASGLVGGWEVEGGVGMGGSCLPMTLKLRGFQGKICLWACMRVPVRARVLFHCVHVRWVLRGTPGSSVCVYP